MQQRSTQLWGLTTQLLFRSGVLHRRQTMRDHALYHSEAQVCVCYVRHLCVPHR